MTAINTRANNASRHARIGLESLETRTVLSVSVPTVPAPVLQAAAVSATTPKPAAATTAAFSYQWTVSNRVLTGTNLNTVNGRSTGSVALATYRPVSGVAQVSGTSRTIPIALVTTISSARPAKPDVIHATVDLKVRIKDAASGKWADVTFKAKVDGTLTYNKSTLVLNVQGSLSQRVKLGTHFYTVTLQARTANVPAPGTTPLQLKASITTV